MAASSCLFTRDVEWLPCVPTECMSNGCDTNFLSMALTLLSLFRALFIVVVASATTVVLLTEQ